MWGETEGERKVHLISWDLITSDRKDGGLGIKNLVKHNETFIMKLCWKLLNDPNALWVRVLTSKYQTVTSSTLCLRKGKSASTTWRSICATWESRWGTDL